MNILDEIKNSINSVIAERSVSPLFGSLLLSWLTWNWKIIYILFGHGNYSDYEDRLEYIEIFHSEPSNLYYYPLISTIAVLLIYPILSILAYWLWLKFDILKKKIRNRAERNELLTIEESVKVRMELQKSQEITTNLLVEKERVIEQLKKQLEIQISNSIEKEKTEEKTKPKNTNNTKANLKEKIKSNKKLKDSIHYIFECYKNNVSYEEMKKNISLDTFEFYKANNILSEGLEGQILLNYLGEEIYKEYLNDLFN
ncbi:Hypothetical protein LBF_2131 [Leptospira biflexa serovar Patoc strain 'Patoc 1 (Ames)']|uniref:Uncharacterized protein n=1 Tax=Leptospira biflexa serovar Patoc (strain Patoc 1 / ATCC 23582 / Paris) TaxID=456481 RepID=B0ST51_LEPBP|nr:hypothetical protein [Leptospira biflexa]ABZ94628.1 Hypothetical protein LBF_2131 [Leptospira biflexa serovar Patoc strain 'Patoc 1 (Ames)']ABZ98291.1 Hypothetical protein LEPBI_I2192 [Leptospira biflexa serovar Patoc strain 'Patoc 1 (Paris)']